MNKLIHTQAKPVYLMEEKSNLIFIILIHQIITVHVAWVCAQCKKMWYDETTRLLILQNDERYYANVNPPHA